MSKKPNFITTKLVVAVRLFLVISPFWEKLTQKSKKFKALSTRLL